MAAYAAGATRGFVYLRGEYRYLLEPLNAVLAKRRAAICSVATSSAFPVPISILKSTSAPALTCAVKSRH